MPATEHEDPNDELGGGTEEVTSEGNSDDMDDLVDKLMGDPEAEAKAAEADAAEKARAAEEEKAAAEKAAEAAKGKKTRAPAKPKADHKPEHKPEPKVPAADQDGEWFMGHHFPGGVPASTRMEMEMGAARVAEAEAREAARAAQAAEEG